MGSQRKTPVVPLSPVQYIMKYGKLLKQVPSANWADEQFITLEKPDHKGRPTHIYFQNPELSLPSGMKRCPCCKRRMPATYFTSSDACEECNIEAQELPLAEANETFRDCLKKKKPVPRAVSDQISIREPLSHGRYGAGGIPYHKLAMAGLLA